MRKRRVTPGLVLGIVALVIAMTGSAVGASLITGKQVKNSSLTGKDVKDKSLTKKDFKGSVRGATGAPGPTGPTGATGAQGPPGPSDLSTITDNFGTLDVAAGAVDGGTLSCPAGMKIVSGGGEFTTTPGKGAIVVSEANEALDGWIVIADNTNSAAVGKAGADALCAASGKAVATPARAKVHTLRRTKEVRRMIARIKRAG